MGGSSLRVPPSITDQTGNYVSDVLQFRKSDRTSEDISPCIMPNIMMNDGGKDGAWLMYSYRPDLDRFRDAR